MEVFSGSLVEAGSFATIKNRQSPQFLELLLMVPCMSVCTSVLIQPFVVII